MFIFFLSLVIVTSTDLKLMSTLSKLAISSLVISLFKFLDKNSIINNSEDVRLTLPIFLVKFLVPKSNSKSPKYLLSIFKFLLNLDLIVFFILNSSSVGSNVLRDNRHIHSKMIFFFQFVHLQLA